MKVHVRSKWILYVIIVLGIGILTPSFALNYYIDGVNGNNTSGDGSLAKPWKTVSYAIKKTEANSTEDTFYVAAATYKNDPALPVFEREVFPMKIRAKTKIIGAGKGKTIIDAGYIQQTTSRFIEGIADTDMTDILIEGITFRNNNITNGVSPAGIYLNKASGAIKNCEFINLKTTGSIGAIEIIGDNINKFTFSGNLVKDCQSTYNSGFNIGGVSISESIIEFLSNEINNCVSVHVGNIYLYKVKGQLNSNVIKNGNSNAWHVGGIGISESSELEIAYNVFDGNAGCRSIGSHMNSYKNSNVRIHHNVFQNAKYNYDNQSALGFNQCGAHEIDNNIIQSNFQTEKTNICGGIHIYSSSSFNIHHNTIQNNQGANTGAIDIRYSGPGIIINNIITNNRGEYYAGGIFLLDTTANVEKNEISNNYCYTNYDRSAGALSSMSYSKVVNIVENTFKTNSCYKGQGCMSLDAFKGNITENLVLGNICQNSAQYAISIALNNDTGVKTKIANNIIAANTGNGIYLSGGSADTKFFINNTLVNQTQNQLVIASDGWNIFNNIFYGGRISISETNVFTIPLQNNIFYKFTKYLYLDNNQDSYIDLESFEFWKDEAKNNVQKDPLFADAANYDYHLAPQSPAIDGAYDGSKHAPGTFPQIDIDIDLNNRPIDVPGINNNTYPGGDDYAEYDIGADEYVVGASFNISGKVTDTDGNPIQNVDVLAKSLTSSYQSSVKTQSDGTYKISGLEQGKYRITPSMTDTSFWPHFREVAVTYGDKEDINFEAITAGEFTFIRGTVLAFSGAPVSGATVYVTNHEKNISKGLKIVDFDSTTTTNDQGQFNITAPAGSGYFMKVSKAEYTTKILSDITAPDDLIIYLEPDTPSIPTGLKAWGNPQGISLNWNANPETSIIGYNIYRDTSQWGSFNTRINQSLVRTTNFEDSNVTINTTYWYKITAISSKGLESAKSAMVSAIAGSINLFVYDARGIAGGKVRIPISLSDATGVSCNGFSIAFTYDPTMLTPTSFEKTILTKDFTLNSNIASNPNGTLIFTGNCDPNVTISKGAGHIIDVLFDIAGTATGQSAIGFGDVTLKNASGQNITLTKVPAAFIVANDYILGDVDGDGDVDMDDARMAQKIAVQLLSASSLQLAAGDINRDGTIDSADVTMILRIINSLPLNPNGDVPAPASLYILSLGVASGEPGKTVEIPFTIKPLNKMSGCDLVISYDASRLTADDVAIGTAISSSYILEKNLTQPGIIRITLSDKAESEVNAAVIAAKIKFTIASTAAKNYVPIIWQKGAVSRQYGQFAAWEGATIRLVNGCVCIGLSEWIEFEKVINYILGKGTLDTIEFILADREHDGIIDIADPVKMINEGHGPKAK